jgi:signal transduction histidine kinase/ActR/RegA family two-component response regulator
MQLINIGSEPFFEDVVNHMATIAATPLAMVALTSGRLWINVHGTERGREAAHGEMYDAIALLGCEEAVVEDFRPELRLGLFCAAQPVPRAFITAPMSMNGELMGILIIADTRPRKWTDFDINYMKRSARLVASHFGARAALAERDRRIDLERQLAETGALYQAVVSAIHEGVVMQTASGDVIAANAAARKIIGMTDSDDATHLSADTKRRVVNRQGKEIGRHEHPPMMAIETGQPQLGVIVGVEKLCGDLRWVKVNSIPMFEPGSEKPHRVTSTFQDITDDLRKDEALTAALAAAESANRAKSAFLANMSHEIRTPLNGVLGMAQVLEHTKLDREQREFVGTMIDSARTLTTILNDVLDLSKIEAGKFDITPADASLAGALNKQIQLWKPTAGHKGLRLLLSIDGAVPALMSFDRTRVQQCVSNLLSNAIKFTDTGSIDVSASATELDGGEHLVEIRVTDTGSGMNAETIARLFKPFAQGDETASRRHGGTGLGLSITRRLAELMGGTASVDSTPGVGSTFRISFRAGLAAASPQGRDMRRAGRDDVRNRLKAKRLRVLLVDDHPVNRQVGALFLQSLNMRIIQASNGVEALAALGREAFDVVLLDIHMPVMDGPATITRIRENDRWTQIPVIALTADAMSGDRERYLALGMAGYLSKPLAQQDLLAEIARVTGLDSGALQSAAA